MAPLDPFIGGFTPEQLSTLTLQQNEGRKFTKLQLAKEQIEITDGNSAVESERRWALAFYLSGFSDQAVARQVFTKPGNEKTVLNAIKLTRGKLCHFN